MSIDLDAIEARIAAGIYGDDRLSKEERNDAFSALAEIIAEVERLRAERDHFRKAWSAAQVRLDCGTDATEAVREERAAVVAHLRERAIHGAGNTITVEDACTILADLFERGEHCREEER